MLTLQTVWFLLLAVLFIGYAVLDGFDLGIGSLHLLAKGEDEKKTMINAVGPFWDGNEVWLLTGGGAIFAAFPDVYATVFSGFYLALVLLLVALIGRAVSAEFRNKVESAAWKKAWDVVFFLGSFLPAVLLGVAFGNILHGVPVEVTKEYNGGLFGLLNLYAILIGLTSLAMFAMHGAIYLTVKTGGELQKRAAAWARNGWTAFVALYIVSTAASLYFAPHLFDRYFTSVWPWALVVLAVAAIVYTRLCIARESYMAGFVSSSVSIASLIGIAAVGLFPNLVPSTIDPAYSLTVMNASNSQFTLTVMLILVLIGVPVMLFYTAYIYRCFRGKVTAEGGY